jgi:hypothetical protein
VGQGVLDVIVACVATHIVLVGSSKFLGGGRPFPILTSLIHSLQWITREQIFLRRLV